MTFHIWTSFPISHYSLNYNVLPIPEMVEGADYWEEPLHGEGDGHVHTGCHAGLEQIDKEKEQNLDN